MPSVSGKQHRLMAAVATNPAVAKRTGISQSVGKEFLKADKGRTFKKSEGDMKSTKKMAVGGMGNVGGATRGLDQAAAMSGRAMPATGARPAGMKKGGATKTSKMGAVRTAAPSLDGVAAKGKTQGKKVVMAGASRGLKKGGKC